MQWNSHFAPARFLLIVILCLTTLHIAAVPKPLPDAVVHAHTVFLVNETSFNELQYSTIFELNKLGRFDLPESPEKADLIMRLDSGSHVRPVPEGQFPTSGGVNAVDESEIPKGCTRISLSSIQKPMPFFGPTPIKPMVAKSRMAICSTVFAKHSTPTKKAVVERIIQHRLGLERVSRTWHPLRTLL